MIEGGKHEQKLIADQGGDALDSVIAAFIASKVLRHRANIVPKDDGYWRSESGGLTQRKTLRISVMSMMIADPPTRIETTILRSPCVTGLNISSLAIRRQLGVEIA